MGDFGTTNVVREPGGVGDLEVRPIMYGDPAGSMYIQVHVSYATLYGRKTTSTNPRLKKKTEDPAAVALCNISYAFQIVKYLGRESKRTRMRKGSVCFRPFECGNVQICPAAPTGRASSVPSIEQEAKGVWSHPNGEMQMEARRRAMGRMMRTDMDG